MRQQELLRKDLDGFNRGSGLFIEYYYFLFFKIVSL